MLYVAALGVVVLALALVVTTLLVGRAPRDGRQSSARQSTANRLLVLSAFVTGVGAAALPVLQPTTLRDDTISQFSSNNAWTASPSPETSFWGSCTRGAYNGLCASGGSASWGPDWGWAALVIALALLLVVVWRRRARSAGSDAAGQVPKAGPDQGPRS